MQATHEKKISTLIIILFIVAIVIVVLDVFFFLRVDTYDQQINVSAMDWRRVQPVEGFKTLHQDTDVSSIPTDAYNIQQYDATRNVRSRCSRVINDSNGVAQTQYYDCDHQETETRARYDLNRWVWDHDLVTQGTFNDPLVWPDFAPTSAGVAGAERAGQRTQALTVHFLTHDHKIIDYLAPGENTWRKFQVGEAYTVKINRLEQPEWGTLQRVDAR